jgi:hypothetical protein
LPPGQATHGEPNLPAGHASAQSDADTAPGAEEMPLGHVVGAQMVALARANLPAGHILQEFSGWPAVGW